MEISRRLRAIVSLAATWGFALSALATSSLAVGLASGLVPGSIFGARELVQVAIRGLIAGATSGALFGWLLSSREHGQAVSTLSRRRIALWGFIAAGSIPAVIGLAAGAIIPAGVLAAAVVIAGVGGSVFSMSLLRLARREPGRALPDVGNTRRYLP